MALLEVCVDSFASAKAAYLGGADRLELCGCLSVGGVTPSIALFDMIARNFPIPIRVLIRPRGGDFLYSEEEKSQMEKEISLFRERGAEGVVIGALTKEGDLDEGALFSMIERAGKNLKLTLHRAFDKCRDPLGALETAKKLGFDAVLTSGQKRSALAGVPLLRELHALAAGELNIMAGGGVNRDNILEIHKETGITCFHASCKKEVRSGMLYQTDEVNMGYAGVDEYSQYVADEGEVLSCLKIVHAL